MISSVLQRHFKAILCLLMATGAMHAPAADRIVSLSPNITEILYALDLGPEIVGVTRFCRYPEEARNKPYVGGFTDINMETLVSLHPDLVILLPYHGKTEATLASFSIPTLRVRNETLAEIREAIQDIGAATGREDRARSLTDSLDSVLDRIRQEAAMLPKKKVLFVVGRNHGTLEALYGAGPGTFIHELITLCGGDNILSGVPILYPKLTPESILASDPEVILEAVTPAVRKEASLEAHRRAWARIPGVTAFRRNAIYTLEQDFLLIPGPRMGVTAQLLFDCIHGLRQNRSVHE